MLATRLLIFGLVLAASPAIVSAAPSYNIQVAVTGTNNRPVVFNNAGDIVFQDIDPNLTYSRANVLYANGTRIAFGLPNTELSYVNAINERGQAVGYSFGCCDRIVHPVLLSDGQVTRLDINGGRLRNAYDINSAGHISGEFLNDADQVHAVIYDGSNYRDLGSGGGLMTTANYINDHDQVAGVIAPIGDAVHAFFYSDGVMTDINALSGFHNTGAYGINDLGQMIGSFSPPVTDQHEHGFLYFQGQFTELTPGSFSRPMAINNLGQIVGTYGNGLGDPFIWQDGAYAHLNALIDPAAGYALQYAADINDNGTILAWGCGKHDRNACDILVLTPVPESPAWLMMASGLGLLMLRARRSRSH